MRLEMRQHVVRSLLALLLLVFGCAVHSADGVFKPTPSLRQKLDPFLHMLKDPTNGRLTVQEVAQGQAGVFGEAGDNTVIDGVVFEKTVFWARLDVDLSDPHTNAHAPYAYLLFQPELMGRVEVFFPLQAGGFGSVAIDERDRSAAQDVALQSQLVKVPTIFRAGLTPLYVRFEPRLHPLNTSITWVTQQAAMQEVASSQFMRGLLLAALCTLVLYNAFLLFTTRDWAYLIYVYYLSCFTLLMSLITGLKLSFLPFGATATAVTVLTCGILHSGIWFFRHFLTLASHAPRMNKCLVVLQFAVLGTAGVAAAGGAALAYPVAMALTLPTMVGLILVSVVRWRQGFTPARFSVLGVSVHVLITTVYLMESFKLLPTEYISIYWVGAGGVWEALCFSFALAYRVRLAEDAKQTLIEEQKLSLAAEQNALALAHTAQTEKNTFLSMISHELRSPLQSIVAALDVEALHDRGPGHKNFLRKVDWAVKRIDSQHRDLLILSVGEAGKLEMRPEPFEVGDLVQDVLQTLAPKAREKGLALHVDADQDDQALFVVADPKRIEQVLANLVENAVKYTAHGQVSVSYELLGATQLQLVVHDTGAGISPEHQRALFTPYTRFGSVERGHNSSGIGLAVVKTLLTHLGGSVKLVSTVNVGSTFTVIIPVVVTQEVNSPTANGHSGQRILIVDDRQDVLDALCTLSASLGLIVDAANSAAIGANYLGARAYDVVLIDLDMPFKNGHELASETRRGQSPNRATRLIAISAGTGSVFASSTSCWPFDDFVQKPIHKAQLQRMVEPNQ
jgi:signal transduction histidine kinase